MQWNNGVWWWRHCLWCKKVKPVDAVDAVCSGHSECSGIVVYGGVSAVYCIHCIHWFDLFVPKTMSSPPYTTILLCPLRTVSPPPHITIALHTASTVSSGLTFCTKDNVPTIYYYSTVSIAYCVHCILRPLHNASTRSSHLCVILT